jgi:ribosomal protein S18 acetylase RimI-like enzyme
MDLSIQKTTSDDIGPVIALMREFAAYEDLAEFCDVTPERLFAAMFGDNAVAQGLCAYDGKTPVGYALFYPSFSSFRGQRGLYLEDIFIEEEYRGSGLGEAMLRQIASIAHLDGCERIDFMVLDWNTPAIKFYEKLGAVRDKDDRHFKFTDEAFKTLLS